MSSLMHGSGTFGVRLGVRDVTVGLDPKPSRKGGMRGNKPLLTDEQILEMRALSQYGGWGCDALMLRYGVDKDMVYRVVEGITRSRLVASPRHLPAGVTAK